MGILEKNDSLVKETLKSIIRNQSNNN